MIELALLIWVVTWCVKNAVADIKYAALGQTPPRHQLKMARLAAAGKSSVKPRYGSREYFADFAADLLEAKTAKRRELAAKKAKSVREVDLNAATDEALAVAAPAVVVPEPATVEAVTAPEPESTEPALIELGPTARIIPMFPTKKEVSDMSEITGLQSAIAYAQQVAGAHSAHSTGGGEAYLGSLQSYEVSGQAIALVAAAQEASSIAAGAWSAAAAELGKQTVVKEAYDSVPGAGNKAFVQGE